MNHFAEANTNFAVELFKNLEEQHSRENVFISPISIAAAFSMLLIGANGNTAVEMEQPPGAQCDKPGGPYNLLKEILSAITQNTKSCTLSIANRLYGSNDCEFLQEYIECSEKLHLAELETVDFCNETEKVRTKINSWVESQTNGKIKDLFRDGSFDQATILILVIAIYFKGKWMMEFDPENTHEADFWISKDQSKKVQMMTQTGNFNLGKIADPPMQVLELPYDNKDLSMLILRPDNGKAIAEIVTQLTYEKFQEWTSSANMQNTEIKISMPKFKMEEEYSLISTLKSMGMNDVFIKGKADLSGMSRNRDLIVSQILHKSYIEVNEEGTEAAAATSAVVALTNVQMIPEFTVNFPVLFFIRRNSTQTIIFIGKLSSP